MRRAILLALCVVLPSTTMARGIFARLFLGGGHVPGMERQYRVIKGKKLGTFLAGEFAGKRAVILLPPEPPPMPEDFDSGEEPCVAVFKGLLAGRKGVKVVATIRPKMPAAVKAKMERTMAGGDMMMPEALQWFGVKELNKELAAYKGKYDLLICLGRLPGTDGMGIGGGRKQISYKELNFWKEKGVSVAIAEGGISRFGKLIEEGKICAVVNCKRMIQDADYEKRPAKDLDEAFATRFVLITPENVEEHRAYFRR